MEKYRWKNYYVLERYISRTYFSAINSFDNDKGEGLFSDEKGIKFRVHNLIYNNTYHFGCEDDYLATILNEQNYISQASDIATKYGYALAYDEENEIVSIQYAEDFQQTDDFHIIQNGVWNSKCSGDTNGCWSGYWVFNGRS